MNSNWTKLEGNVGELTLEFTGAEWTSALDKALTKIAKTIKINGFRPGKAPKSMVKKMVSSASLYQEAMNDVMDANYYNALVENKVEPIAQPQLTVETVNDEMLKVKLTVEIMPEVELGQYKGFDIKKKQVRVTEKEIQAEIDTLRNEFAEVVVKEGTVETGDIATIDFEGFLDGVAFEGGKGENHPLEIGSGSFIPGFEDQVVGMAVEETKDITVTFPENYHAEDLKGKEVVFKVTVHKIETKQLPELNDELAKDTNIEGVSTVEELQAHVKEKVRAKKQETAENEYSEAVFNALLENTNVVVPDALVEQEMQGMLQEISANLQQQGIDFETYKQIIGKTTEDIKEELKDQAAQKAKFNLVVGKVVEVEGITATEEEIEKEYETLASYYGQSVEDIKKALAPQAAYVASNICTRKAIAIIKGE